MNENVKIDYDTAEKVMDLDGSKVYVKTIGDKTRADGVQRGCVAFDTYADGAERIPAPRRSMKIMMIPGFSWAKSVGPKLPKLPDGSCPASRPRPKLRDAPPTRDLIIVHHAGLVPSDALRLPNPGYL